MEPAGLMQRALPLVKGIRFACWNFWVAREWTGCRRPACEALHAATPNLETAVWQVVWPSVRGTEQAACLCGQAPGGEGQRPRLGAQDLIPGGPVEEASSVPGAATAWGVPLRVACGRWGLTGR